MQYNFCEVLIVTPNQMLRSLSDIWTAIVEKYPQAKHEEILEHILALQLLIFPLTL